MSTVLAQEEIPEEAVQRKADKKLDCSVGSHIGPIEILNHSKTGLFEGQLLNIKLSKIWKKLKFWMPYGTQPI